MTPEVPDQKYEEIIASLKRSHRRSWLRFFIFLGFVLVLWISTYVITKGQFSIFSRKIAVVDTLVINQDSAMAARDSIIADQRRLINVLQKSQAHPDNGVPPVAAGPSAALRSDTIRMLNQRILHRNLELKVRDSVTNVKRKEYYPLNAVQQMAK
ncbi:MAG: hypothetical protein Q8916_05525 [Bacteroidota bacterium]|nr:hypothetical protein [Bacteroidota bacterium]MDP4229850.1 hypothetical protein [Bacteroidota bacterium]MDP4234975.1 hypothetical protein [Bacteroidota bacterium]